MIEITIKQLEEHLYGVTVTDPAPGLAGSSQFCETPDEVVETVREMLDEYKNKLPPAANG